MRAPALYTAAGSLLLTTLATGPAGGAPAAPGAAELHGTAVAAARAGTAGVRFGACPEAEDLPGSVRCGTVSVPLDYAHPDGKQIKLTVSRVRATQKDPHNGKHRVPRQGALVYNPGGPGASGMYFPLIGALPEWKGLAAAYDLVGYAPRGVGRSAPLSCKDPKQFFTAPTQAPAHPRSRTRRNASPRRRPTRAAARGGRALPCGTTPP